MAKNQGWEISSFNGIVGKKTEEPKGDRVPIINTQVIEQPIYKGIEDEYLLYEYAEDLANKIDFEKQKRYACVVNGSFICGDFIEALIINKGLKVKKAHISTLSLNENNVQSLKGLLVGGQIEELELIVSHFWWSHQKWNLVPYLYNHLDIENRFQLGVASSHMKTTLLETYCGKYIVIDGSANLLSSNNIEQFRVEDNKSLFDFYSKVQEKIVDYYKTINKPLRGKKLWHQVQNLTNM